MGLNSELIRCGPFSIIDTLNEQFQLIDAKRDTIGVLDHNYITANSQSVRSTFRENLGVFVQPKITIPWLGDEQNEESIVNLLGHCEWTRSIINAKLSRNLIAVDTTEDAPDSWPVPYEISQSLPEAEQNEKFLEYNINIGVGLDFTLNRSSGSLHFKSIIGKNNFKLVKKSNNTNTILNDDACFYLIQGEVMERKILGLKLGVEVRGYFNNDRPPLTLDRNTPYFTIYLAKQLNFKKIADLFKP